MRSRLSGRGIGAAVFTSTPTTCPPGQHYVAPAATAVRGLGDCVPNKVLTLHLSPPAAAAAPAPTAAPVTVQPLTFQTPAPVEASAPPAAAAAPAPAAAPCPALWPWWWLAIAFGIGAAGGVYMQKNQKAVKRNAGRMAAGAGSRIVNRASDAAIARLLG